MRGYPAFKKNIALEGQMAVGILSNPNPDWFMRAFAADHVENISSGYTVNLSLAALPYFHKSKNIWIAAGPQLAYWIGAGSGSISTMYPANRDNDKWFLLRYGLRARMYYKHTITISVGYDQFSPGKLLITNDQPGSPRSIQFSKGLFSIGIGIFTRFNDD